MKNRETFRKALAAAKTEEEVGELFFQWSGKSRDAVHLIASDAPHVGAGLLALIMETGAGPVGALLKNPGRPADTEEKVVQWCLNRLRSEAARDPLERASSLLLKLAREGHWDAASPAMDDLLAIAIGRGNNFTRRQSEAARTIASHPDSTTAILDELASGIGDKAAPDVLLPLAAHPALSAEARRPLVPTVLRDAAGLLSLLVHESIRRDPEIRPMLVEKALASGLNRALRPLAQDGVPADCRRLFAEQGGVDLRVDARMRKLAFLAPRTGEECIYAHTGVPTASGRSGLA